MNTTSNIMDFFGVVKNSDKEPAVRVAMDIIRRGCELALTNSNSIQLHNRIVSYIGSEGWFQFLKKN